MSRTISNGFVVLQIRFIIKCNEIHVNIVMHALIENSTILMDIHIYGHTHTNTHILTHKHWLEEIYDHL